MTTRQPGGDVVDAYLTNDEHPEADMQPYRWTSQDTLETDPHGIPPVAAEIDDAALWPTVRDRKGRVVRSYRPDPAAVQTAVTRSRAMRRYDVAELAEAPSHDEIAEVIAQGARQRSDGRALDDARHRHEIDQAYAQIDHDAQVADDERQHDNDVRQAQRRQARATDPTSLLVRLAWAEKWLPVLAMVPAAFALAAGAVNVFNELQRINPETRLVNWAVEPLFTLPLVVILLAQMLGALPKPDFSRGVGAALRTNRYVGMEVGLTAMAIVLNVVPHWLPKDHWTGDLVWLVVPAGLGFSAYLVPRLVTDIRQALREWSAETSRAGEKRGFSIVSDLHGKNPETPGENVAENPSETASRRTVREPEKRTKQEARETFFAKVERGEIDPENDSVNTVAKKLGTRWGNANDFLAEWRDVTASAA
ncbi:hypothetical protein AB0I53_11940 [Saccharopolyspora sp. NPDC050389]|uniref:hypothetical protein n=1 Tax=Saccharopolyspora sp. NPDC050389 TaxID=3155516 RepID=UPI0033FA3F90